MTKLLLSDYSSVDEFMEAIKTEQRGYSTKDMWSALIYIGSWLAILAIICISLMVGCKPARAEPITLIASWYSVQSLKNEGTYKYSKGVQANGKLFDENAFTVASCDFPLGAKLKITTIENPKKSIIVEVTDRTNKRFKGKRIDLAKSAFEKLSGGRLDKGILQVTVEAL